MDTIKKKVKELNLLERKAILKNDRYLFIQSINLFLVGETLWWECIEPEKGKAYLDSCGLVQVR